MKFKIIILSIVTILFVSSFCYSQKDSSLSASSGIKNIYTAIQCETKVPIIVNRSADGTFNRVKVVALNSPYGDACIKLSTDKLDNKFEYTFTPDKPGSFTLMIQASDQRYPPSKLGVATDTMEVVVENPIFADQDFAPVGANLCEKEDIYLDFAVKGLPNRSDYKLLVSNASGGKDTIKGSILQKTGDGITKGQTFDVTALYRGKEFSYFDGTDSVNFDPKNYKPSSFSLVVKDRPQKVSFAQKVNEKIRTGQSITVNGRRCCTCGGSAEPLSITEIKDIITETIVKVVGQDEIENLYDDEREIEEVARGRYAIYLKEDLVRQISPPESGSTVDIEVTLRMRNADKPEKKQKFKLDLGTGE